MLSLKRKNLLPLLLNGRISGLSFFLFLFNQICISQPGQTLFNHLTTDDGLSFNTVYSIIEDRQGFIWIGTLDGLNRYDGIEFKNYRVIEEKYYQMINRIVEDSLGNIWTGDVLLRYNSEYDKQQFIWTSTQNGLRWSGDIKDIITGPDHHVYVARNNGIYACGINPGDSLLYEFRTPRSSPPFNLINKINFDRDQNLWLGTDQGIFYFDSIKNEFSKFTLSTDFEQEYVHDFLFDKKGNIWVAFTNHLLAYSFVENEAREYRFDGIEKPVLTSIFQSRNGNIWVGTNEKGLYYLENGQHQLKCLLGEQSILCIYEDHSNRLWAGTDNAGIFVYDSLRNFFRQLPLDIKGKTVSSFYANKIINPDNEGIWIGTSGIGLIYYDLTTGKTRLLDSENNQINMLYQDRTGKVWYDYLNYLVCYDPFNNTIKKVKHPVPNQFPVINYGNSLTEMISFNDSIIIASDYGQLYCFNPVTEKFRLILEKEHVPIRYMFVYNDQLLVAVYGTGLLVLDKSLSIKDTIVQDNDERGLVSHAISDIYKDSYDTLWITGYGGLSKYNPYTGKLENKLALDQSFNILSSILEDDHGNLWIGSSKGIYKYERLIQKFRFFNSNHGMPTGRFFFGSAVKTAEGKMYFGGNNGIVCFKPDEVRMNAKPPPVVITGFVTNYPSQKEPEHSKSISGKNICQTDSILLKYNQNSFTIKYAALNYTSSRHNQFKYKLEGLDRDWKYVGSLPQATYTNLSGGDYIFHIMAANNDGVWNDKARTLFIRIDSPPWKTWWAVIIYILSILGILIVIYLFNIRKIELQHQLELKIRESENLRELDHAKSQFFANISHEFRTPLTLIMDPANQLLQGARIGTRDEHLIKLILNNSRRLLFLINQILDLAKLRNSKLRLKAEEVDFIPYIKPIIQAFSSRAEALSISFRILLPDHQIMIWIDKEKIEQALINLLSNAFKFCTKGEIRVEVKEETDSVIIEVEDTGIGIPADESEKIFDNYYQVERPNHENVSGSGIGLYLVKEYVNLHKGSIKLQSRENEGSTFAISLLKGKAHLKPEEIIEGPASSGSGFGDPERNHTTIKSGTSPHYEPCENLPTLLLVEDNPEMREYIATSLSDQYKMIAAVNGSEGFDKTLEYYPDIVISDVMMPFMDGYTYCEKVKADIRTSHIPVILLTARDTDNDRIRGLTLGADDYMIKPFNLEELKLRIKYHLEQREKVRAKFLRDFKFKSEEKFIRNLKDEFLRKVMSEIEAHFKDDQFGVEKLSNLMGISRKHLHHKIKILTQQTPNELIRNFRLRKAAYLLSENSGSVTAISYEVGFNNPSYFSKCFAEFHGKYPSEYKQVKD